MVISICPQSMFFLEASGTNKMTAFLFRCSPNILRITTAILNPIEHHKFSQVQNLFRDLVPVHRQTDKEGHVN